MRSALILIAAVVLAGCSNKLPTKADVDALEARCKAAAAESKDAKDKAQNGSKEADKAAKEAKQAAAEAKAAAEAAAKSAKEAKTDPHANGHGQDDNKDFTKKEKCDKDKGTTPAPVPAPAPAPTTAGTFRLNPLVPVGTSTAVDFEMGDLNKTSTYLFELRNTTATNLTNVTIGCDNPAVVITPSAIGVISTAGNGLVPIIQVTVPHGFSANGIGAAPTLKPGRLVLALSAKVNGGTAGTITQGSFCPKTSLKTGDIYATLGMTVRVTNFEITSSGVLLTNRNFGSVFTNYDSFDFVRSNTWSILTPEGVVNDIPVWTKNQSEFWHNGALEDGIAPEVDVQHGPTVFKNTGNTVVTVRQYTQPVEGVQAVATVFNTLTVQPGATVTLRQPDGTYLYPYNYEYLLRDYLIKVTSTGAVFADGCLRPTSGADFWAAIHAQPVAVPVDNG